MLRRRRHRDVSLSLSFGGRAPPRRSFLRRAVGGGRDARPLRGENQFASGDVRRAYTSSVDGQVRTRSLRLPISLSLARERRPRSGKNPRDVAITSGDGDDDDDDNDDDDNDVRSVVGTRTLTSMSQARARARAQATIDAILVSTDRTSRTPSSRRDGTTVCCRSRTAILPEPVTRLCATATAASLSPPAPLSTPPLEIPRPRDSLRTYRRPVIGPLARILTSISQSTSSRGIAKVRNDDEDLSRENRDDRQLSVNTSGSLLRSDWPPRGGVCALPTHARPRRPSFAESRPVLERRRRPWATFHRISSDLRVRCCPPAVFCRISNCFEQMPTPSGDVLLSFSVQIDIDAL